MLIIILVVFSVLSLGAIIYLVARHYPQLAVLDVESLPEVKVAKKKDEYLLRRAEQKARRLNKKVIGIFSPLSGKSKKIQTRFREFVAYVERKAATTTIRKQRTKSRLISPEESQQVRTLVNDANHALESGDIESAEKKYIAAIKINDKNKDAYGGLADVYYKRNHLEEAKQTYRFLLYLEPNNEHALVRLAEMAEREGKIDVAVNYYQQAVMVNDSNSARFAKLYELLMQLNQYDTALEAVRQALILEPQNPKYLDNLVEVSIMVGDNKLAEQAWYELRMVNPENQKLSMLKDRIENMPS
ncbi:MAG: tetratricopeptide repeat protein [Patescibacteria group bacterium]